MAVTKVQEVLDEQVSDSSLSGGVYSRTHQRVFIVTTDSASDNTAVARTANDGTTRIPLNGETWADFDTFARVVGVNARRVRGDPFHFRVIVSYSSNLGSTVATEGDSVTVNPISRAPRYEWSTVRFSRALESALQEGSEVLFSISSSAGELFDPAPVQEESRPVLTIVRNERWDLGDPFTMGQKVTTYSNSVNEGTFMGASARQARMADIRASFRYEGGIRYWEVSYSIHFKRDTWDLQLLDRGFYERIGDGAAAEYFNIVDANGLAISAPVNLDGSGGVLEAGQEPVFLRMLTYKVKNWSPLRLV